MKKIILSILLFVAVAVITNAQETTTSNPINPNAPKFKFETETIDYGTIEHNANGDREFKFTNVGKEPLIITKAIPSCGCTIPIAPTEPILSGASSVIKVHYATDRVGAFEKIITLNSNADTPQKIIKIKGIVKADPAKAISADQK